MIRVVAGTYEGLLYGWECQALPSGERTKMKLTFGYAAHSECIKSVALMAAKQGKTLLSGGSDEMIKCVGKHSKKIHCATFATDEHIVCGGDDKHIYIWKTNGTLVAKVTHKDIDARIRCIQVVYPHGDDKLPWIVLATSDGAFQIWDFAAFTLDASSPDGANKSVEPMASTVLLTKPRVTCLSVCIASDKIANKSAPATQTIKKAKKTKKPTDNTPAAPAAGVPRVVVELDGGKAEGEDEASKKRKLTEGTQQKSKNKKRKQKKSQQ
ncbi:unnamed protein product [Phytophthora fragariaefolia]|uniref:Unnamed protein product n=1 Tax=Phytophthora fragariaefolia TaxID=1490495 RepID=A0A9W7CY23_9STRA|nr:unnamed protein product [Phytophthora fragariaefolia]